MHQHKIGTRAVVPVLHHYAFVICTNFFNPISGKEKEKETQKKEAVVCQVSKVTV